MLAKNYSIRRHGKKGINRQKWGKKWENSNRRKNLWKSSLLGKFFCVKCVINWQFTCHLLIPINIINYYSDLKYWPANMLQSFKKASFRVVTMCCNKSVDNVCWQVNGKSDAHYNWDHRDLSTIEFNYLRYVVANGFDTFRTFPIFSNFHESVT